MSLKASLQTDSVIEHYHLQSQNQQYISRQRFYKSGKLLAMDCMRANGDINVMDDPEGGCIVQADDPQMLAAGTTLDGVGSSGSNSWYWTSMLKLMEQGAAPISSCMSTSTHNINNYTSRAPFTPCQQQTTADTTPPPSASSPSSSSVHDQPMDMLTQNNTVSASDPDSSVWGQEFLSGPIGEHKTSSIACSEDGLHELLYPRTVLELLFSDQLKLEQMPSWPDILQAHTAAGSPAKSFGFPLTSDKIMAGTSAALHDNVSMDSPQLDVKFSQYLQNYSHLSGIDDRLSSSTASSTLSDNAIDQWVAPQATSLTTQCAETMQAHTGAMAHSSPLSNMQQVDLARVKQEYNHDIVPSPPFSGNDHAANFPGQYNIQHHPHNQRMLTNNMNGGGNGFEESMLNNEYEQKPNLLNKLWNPGVINTHDPLAHNHHKHHIYESITAANFSHNLRQLAGLSAANGYNLQSVNNSMNGVGIAGPLQSYMNQPFLAQLAKKSRPFHDGGAAGTTHEVARDHAQQLESALMRKDESMQLVDHHAVEDSKANANGALAGGDEAGRVGRQLQLQHMNKQQQQAQQQQQLSGPEYNFKRSRIEQAAPPSSCSSGSTSTSTTNNSTSSSTPSSFKSQPVRKEKLSERIATLQQLVSPFGKTDTASVLLEAIGYIKFLQEQVQALSSPYLKSPTTQSGDRGHNVEESKQDLRSRGLCLVPLSCTMQVANDNGADYWYGGSFR